MGMYGCPYTAILKGKYGHPYCDSNGHVWWTLCSHSNEQVWRPIKLSWEPHLRWLCVNCERSLNVLKVPSGRSWGGDRSVVMQLYRSLVRSKIDYGSFVYGSATKSKLSIIDPVHNTGIRLATGAFRTSRLESLESLL
jgi:hypothetical protein